MKHTKFIVMMGLLGLVLGSCRTMYPDIMFKSKPEDITVQPDTVSRAYILKPGDILTIHVFANHGYDLVDVNERGGYNIDVGMEYVVNAKGFVRLPLIDTVSVLGLTLAQTEKRLEERYAVYLKEPYVVVKVQNRRVLVFRGRDEGQVVLIQNENMTMIEVLAEAGGVGSKGKAYRIKHIRENPLNPSEPTVRVIDLSTIEGMKQANLYVQANDILYVEPVADVATGLLSQVTPFVGIVTSFASILTSYLLIQELSK